MGQSSRAGSLVASVIGCTRTRHGFQCLVCHLEGVEASRNATSRLDSHFVPGARDGNTRLAAPDDREPTVRKLIGGRLGARRRNPSLTMGVLGCRSRSSQFRSQLCSQLDSFSDMAFARLFFCLGICREVRTYAFASSRLAALVLRAKRKLSRRR